MDKQMTVDKFKKLMPEYYLYPESLRRKDDSCFFIANTNGHTAITAPCTCLESGTLDSQSYSSPISKDNQQKYLAVCGEKNKGFEGRQLKENIKLCLLNHNNAELLRGIFTDLSPVISDNKMSFGFGDRLGVVTPAHIKCIRKHPQFFPVFAQQSVRENSRTGRSMQYVLDDALWGCMEAGYNGAYGADADHIKDVTRLKEGVKAGYSWFTIDLSDYIRNPVEMSSEEKESYYSSIPKAEEIKTLFLNKEYTISQKRYIFTESEIKKIIITFLKGLDFVKECYELLKDSKGEFDFEISIDEIGIPATQLDHIFIAEYLKRNNVRFNALALSFPGEFQKAIDYRGDLKKFEESYRLHSEISEFFGNYKLSIHSGSDKFSIYPIIHKISDSFHVKTAGTSWLEGVKTIALKSPSLYRRIHKCALRNIEKDRASYVISLDAGKIPQLDSLPDEELINLFSLPDSRQLIHITYGSILSEFREEIYRTLFLNEADHYRLVEEHLNKHLNLLNS